MSKPTNGITSLRKRDMAGGNRYVKKIRRDINPAQVSRAEKMVWQWMKEHE
jgi:hypothetical protein